jgi:hypothetical protein
MQGSSSALRCAVCHVQDARQLTRATLASGAVVVVCGSHAIAHERVGRGARSAGELQKLTADRREGSERRGVRHGEVDELAEKLASAFTTERRAAVSRRAGA